MKVRVSKEGGEKTQEVQRLAVKEKEEEIRQGMAEAETEIEKLKETAKNKETEAVELIISLLV